jgi:hypothetical protein
MGGACEVRDFQPDVLLGMLQFTCQLDEKVLKNLVKEVPPLEAAVEDENWGGRSGV